MVEIRGRDLIFSRYDGPKRDKGSIRRMKMKETMRIYLREVSIIGRKQCYIFYNVLKMVKGCNVEVVKWGNVKMVK